MRLVFGGTFDPVHMGHLQMATELADVMSSKFVYMMPCYQAVHKQGVAASAEQRLEMLRLSLRYHDNLRVDEREIARGKSSFTIDSLLDIREEIADDSLCFVVGTDAVQGISTWRSIHEFSALTNLIVIDRPGYHGVGKESIGNECAGEGGYEATLQALGFESALSPNDLKSVEAGKYLKLKLSAVDVSSSMVRAMLAQGKCISPYVTGAVNEYICDNALYRN